MNKKTFFDYEGFVEKFKPKKTTDDCYTPPEVYEVIKDWVCNRYGINPEIIVRPFYPGGDFENFNYPEGCLVLDNPPFSILAKIKRFFPTFLLFSTNLHNKTISCPKGTVYQQDMGIPVFSHGILLQKRRQPRIYKALRKDPQKGHCSQKNHVPCL